MGRLNAAKLVDLLPHSNLLNISMCGAPRFTAAVTEEYIRVGLPRSLLSVIS